MTASGYVPNASQELLLKAACAAEPTARKAWRAWSEGRDLTAPDPVSARFFPWLYCRREILALSTEEVARLEPVYRYSWFQNQRLMNSAATLLRDLRADDIPVLILKGLPLLITAYRDEGARYMEDFDLIVPVDYLDRTLTKLSEKGWLLQYAVHVTEEMRQWRHSTELRNPEGIQCDLHWRLLRPPYPIVDEASLWVGRRSLHVRDAEASMPAHEAMLLHLFVHGISWERLPAVRWILDSHLLLKERSVDWQAFLLEVRRREVGLAVREALEIYSRILPNEIPAEVLRAAAEFGSTRRQRATHKELTVPYEQASLRVRWNTYRRHLREEQFEGRIPAGLPGIFTHLRVYWRLRSVRELPREFIRRVISKLFRALRKRSLTAGNKSRLE